VTLIDLNKSTDDRPEPGGVPRYGGYRMVLVSGLLAIGGVVGGFGTYQWQAQRLQVAQESKISVLIFPGTISWAGGSASSYPWIGEGTNVVDMDGQVAIVNAGPSPINIQNLSVDQQGFTLRSTEKGGRIEPGEALLANVSVKISCASSDVLRGIHALLSMETMNNLSLELPSSVIFDGSPWNTEVSRACGAGK
jgi:hypothetical protein